MLRKVRGNRLGDSFEFDDIIKLQIRQFGNLCVLSKYIVLTKRYYETSCTRNRSLKYKANLKLYSILRK